MKHESLCLFLVMMFVVTFCRDDACDIGNNRNSAVGTYCASSDPHLCMLLMLGGNKGNAVVGPLENPSKLVSVNFCRFSLPQEAAMAVASLRIGATSTQFTTSNGLPHKTPPPFSTAFVKTRTLNPSQELHKGSFWTKVVAKPRKCSQVKATAGTAAGITTKNADVEDVDVGESSEEYDAIVIGAGIGGLVAATQLAIRGARVMLLEKYVIPGGSSGYFEREGYTFDVGSSVMFGFSAKVCHGL